ncbi:alkaline phosphatase family protein [Hyalangium versicolor]|uniref:alkaline phosphatase family protein n=1 Tax=Hyalangium versicolor TaxID=2861190 RepID=UPI001CCD292F|nr:ectonucleotide pyrophosphatase/phosphodiesterase [Hyalangium versicolor]
MLPVILLSIDGLKPDYVLEADRHHLKVPNLRRLVREGTFASGVTGVAPTLTYPSHTTLITGVSPARHGIFMNSPFDPFGKNQGGWFWYSEDIQAPTLWDVAGKAGLVTASIDWPVSVGANVRYNIVQYWRASTQDDHKLARALSTSGLLDEAEKDCGPYPTGYAYLLPDDARRAKFISWMIEKKRPHLLTGYFSSLDEEQHLTAPYSQVTFDTLEGLDTLIGEVRAAAERAYQGRFVLAVVSDHGHTLAANELHLNAALRAAGLIELDTQQKVKSWRAFAWASGGSARVMLRDAGDEDARGRVREMLRSLAASSSSGIERVLEGESVSVLGGFPGAAFVVALKPGFKAGSGLNGETMRMGNAGGTHGYLPGPRDMEAAFFIVGPGIAAARDLGKIDMRDIAPTLAGILRLSLPSEGRDLFR